MSNTTAKMSAPVSLRTKSRFDDEEGTAPAATAGFFATRRFQVVIATALIAVAAIAATGLFANRYALIAAARTENAIVYRIDRLTGRVSLCWPSACIPLEERKEGGGDPAGTR